MTIETETTTPKQDQLELASRAMQAAVDHLRQLYDLAAYGGEKMYVRDLLGEARTLNGRIGDLA